jgi:hypothetical protein
VAKRKRKRITDEEVRGWISAEFWESHERADRVHTERIAYYDRRIEEKRRAGGDGER